MLALRGLATVPTSALLHSVCIVLPALLFFSFALVATSPFPFHTKSAVMNEFYAFINAGDVAANITQVLRIPIAKGALQHTGVCED